MPEEATEQMVAEVAKELLVKGVGLTLKFGKTVAVFSAKTVAGKVSEHRNTGRMDIKRLYKVSKGNLAQIKLEQQELLKDLEKDLKRNGVNYSIENGHDGSQYLNVSGSDVAHASHIIEQVLAKHAVISGDKLAKAQEQLQAPTKSAPSTPTHEETSEADTAEFPAVEQQEARATPDSLEYVPTREEAEYMESMGFGESQRFVPAPKLSEYHEQTPESVNFTPTREEAEYMESMGFDERPPYMNAEETAQTVEQDMDDTDLSEPTEQREQHELHQSTEQPDEPERIESHTDSTQDIGETDPGIDGGGDTLPDGTGAQDPGLDQAIDTRQETSTKRTGGRTEKKLTTKQKLRQMIGARAREKMAAHDSPQLSHDMKHEIGHAPRRK